MEKLTLLEPFALSEEFRQFNHTNLTVGVFFSSFLVRS